MAEPNPEFSNLPPAGAADIAAILAAACPPGAFAAADFEQWRQAVEAELKGASFEKKLVAKLIEGLTVQPLHTAAAAADRTPSSPVPSPAPSSSPVPMDGADGRMMGREWEIRATHAHPDRAVTAAAIRADVRGGATGITIRLDAAGRAGFDADEWAADDPATLVAVDGVPISTATEWATLIPDDNGAMNRVGIALDAGESFLAAAAFVAAVAQQRGQAVADVKAAFGADPLGTSETVGAASPAGAAVILDDAFAMMADLAAWTAQHMPQSTAVAVDTRPYHEAGAHEAQDLAIALATGVEYLRQLTSAGLDLASAARQFEFSFAIDDRFYVGIAKLRAARRLWRRVLDASGADASTAVAMRIHACTAARMMAVCDPWTNMLRTTVAAFAAAVGGADAVTVAPFDAAIGLPDDFSRRIARHTSLILQQESQVHRVADPAAGAYFFETLTRDLAHAAWSIFQQIETHGGIVAALADGMIARMIAATAAERAEAIATRKLPLVGVSEFANPHETPVVRPAPNLADLRATTTARLTAHRDSNANHPTPQTALDMAMAKVAETWQHTERTMGALTTAMIDAAKHGATLGAFAKALSRTPPGTPVAAEIAAETELASIRAARLAEPFDVLRRASDEFFQRTNGRPRVFIAAMGTRTEWAARVEFTQNLLAVAGIESVANGEGFSSAVEVGSAYLMSGCELAVIASTDARYETMAADTAEQLKAHGAKWVILAGRPGERESEWRTAGVDEFIFVGVDAVTTLRGWLKKLGASQ